MGVEDGAALGVLFSSLPSKSEIPARLHLFQSLRLARVSAMQIMSSVGQDEQALIADVVRPYIEGPVPSKQTIPAFLGFGDTDRYSDARGIPYLQLHA